MTTFRSNKNSAAKKIPVAMEAPPKSANLLNRLIHKGIKITLTIIAMQIGVYGMIYLG